jgi:CheY-like chemotaxis protein
MNYAPVIIVDDDPDDFDLLKLAWEELKYENELLFFTNGEDALTYMKTNNASPILVISDINLAGDNGFKLRQNILDDPELKAIEIPFVFWSTSAPSAKVAEANEVGADSFFLKPASFRALKKCIKDMMDHRVKL